MKYELDTWYGWTGGECPVHPEDKVGVLFRIHMGREHKAEIGAAKDLNWDARGLAAIIAFRIIERHKEPEPKGLVWLKWPDGTECCDTPDGPATISKMDSPGATVAWGDRFTAHYNADQAKRWLQGEINRKAREYAKLSTDEQPEDDAGEAREFWAYRGGDGHWRVGRAKPICRWDETIRVREVK